MSESISQSWMKIVATATFVATAVVGLVIWTAQEEDRMMAHYQMLGREEVRDFNDQDVRGQYSDTELKQGEAFQFKVKENRTTGY